MFRSVKYLFTITSFVSLGLFMGCGDSTGVDSSLGKATFTMKAHALRRSLTMTDESGTSFIITEAMVNIRHIEFELSDNDSVNDSDTLENSTKISGPFVVDLISGVAMPAIDEIELPVGLYKRIDVRLDDVKDSDGIIDSTDDLNDNTLIVKGTFDYDGNSERPFEIRLKLNEDVRFESATGIEISSVGVTDILLNLKVSEWLETTDITDALNKDEISLENNGSLVLTDESAGSSDLENTIKETIKNKYDLND